MSRFAWLARRVAAGPIAARRFAPVFRCVALRASLGVALWVAPLAEPLAAQAVVPITSVTETGSARFSAAAIIAASGLKVGQPFDAATVKAAVDKLDATGLFAKLRYSYFENSTGASVALRVTDAQNFLPVRFDDFLWFTPAELNAALASVPLYDGAIPYGSLDGIGAEVCAKLQSLLAARGLPGEVTADYSSSAPGAPPNAVVVSVSGVNFTVARTDFLGASPANARDLAATLAVCFRGAYSTVSGAQCVARGGRIFYQRRGFQTAVVGPPAVALTAPNGTVLSLKIPVTEGRQYRLGSLAWTGDLALTAAQLTAAAVPDPKDPYADYDVTLRLAAARSAYEDLGYLQAQLTPTLHLDPAAGVANFSVVVNEGPQYHVGVVKVFGLSDAAMARFQRLWTMKTGDVYNQDYWKHWGSRKFMALRVRRGSYAAVSDPVHKLVNINLTFLQ